MTLAAAHDVDGPRVRLGVVWFVLVLAAPLVSRTLLGVVMALAAAAAADQMVRLSSGEMARHTAGRLPRLVADPRRLPAAVGAASLPLAAAAGIDTLAAALPIVVASVLAYRLLLPARGAVAESAVASAAAVAFGLAGAAPVLAAALGPAVAVVLMLLVCAYDAGDYLVGSGASTTWEGPAAGLAAVVVVTFAVAVVARSPVDQGGAVALGAVTAALAPLGPLAASLLIGGGHRRARFVRRLDSLLVLGPVVAYVAAAMLPAA